MKKKYFFLFCYIVEFYFLRILYVFWWGNEVVVIKILRDEIYEYILLIL